jgi:hypothetical protein
VGFVRRRVNSQGENMKGSQTAPYLWVIYAAWLWLDVLLVILGFSAVKTNVEMAHVCFELLLIAVLSQFQLLLGFCILSTPAAPMWRWLLFLPFFLPYYLGVFTVSELLTCLVVLPIPFLVLLVCDIRLVQDEPLQNPFSRTLSLKHLFLLSTLAAIVLGLWRYIHIDAPEVAVFIGVGMFWIMPILCAFVILAPISSVVRTQIFALLILYLGLSIVVQEQRITDAMIITGQCLQLVTHILTLLLCRRSGYCLRISPRKLTQDLQGKGMFGSGDEI